MNTVNEPVRQSSIAVPQVAWGAILAGLIITVVTQLLLTLLGIGLGAASIDTLQERDPSRGLGTGAVIWFLITSLISIYVGARTAGRLSAAATESGRALHGVLTWGTTTIVSFVFLATTIGPVLGGAASMFGGATAAMSNRQVSPQGYAQLNSTPRTATTGVRTDDSQTEAVSQFDSAAASIKDKARSRTDAALTPTGRETDDLRAYNAEQKVRLATDTAAKRVSQAALWSFFVLVCSGILASYAARHGFRTAPIRRTAAYPNLHTENPAV